MSEIHFRRSEDLRAVVFPRKTESLVEETKKIAGRAIFVTATWGEDTTLLCFVFNEVYLPHKGVILRREILHYGYRRVVVIRTTR